MVFVRTYHTRSEMGEAIRRRDEGPEVLKSSFRVRRSTLRGTLHTFTQKVIECSDAQIPPHEGRVV